jgi:hypothetical protein
MNSPVCQHLRTKKMFTVATVEEALQEDEHGHINCHFWCNKTQTVVGADDSPAHKYTCNNPSRRCFEE